MRNSAFLAIAAVGALAGSHALGQGPVYSVNIVGFQKVSTGPAGLEMVANPFVSANTSIQSVIGSANSDGGLAPDEADKTYFYDTLANGYKIYFLYNNAGDPNDSLNGKWLDENYIESTETVVPGKGFFYANTAGGNTNTLTMVGDVVSAPTVSVTILPGLNQLSYSYSTSIDVNAMALKQGNGAVGGLAPDDADNLFVWSQAANGYVRLFLYFDNTGTGDDNKWLDENYLVPSLSIQPGQAFFYSRGTAAGNLTWTENKPYP